MPIITPEVLKKEYPNVVSLNVDIEKQHIHIVAEDGYNNPDVSKLIDYLVEANNFSEDELSVRLSKPVKGV